MYDDRRLEAPILRKALAVFIDHAETLIERGGPVVLLFGPPKDLLAAIDIRSNPRRGSTNPKRKTVQKEDPMTQSSATQRGSEQANPQFNIDRTHPGRWTITFSNPPINMFLPTTIVELGALMSDLEADPSVKVVVFQSANPDFSSPIST